MAMSTNRARNLFNSLKGKLSKDFNIVEIFTEDNNIHAKLDAYPEWTIKDFAIAKEIGVILSDGHMFCSTNLV